MHSKINELIHTTSSIFLDKTEVVKLTTVCVLAGGHLLIEDVPGVGKTTLVKTLGKLLGLNTHRIQFTIDLLPADILGGHIFDPKTQEFKFYPGPLFAQLVLADELNRASPRTQSALLQAMEEEQVSLDGKTWDLPSPFFVIATQNPHENLGTFQLPESQIDRFMFSLELGYTSKQTEIDIFQSQNPQDKIKNLKALFNSEEILSIQGAVAQVHVSPPVAEYVAQLLENSRAQTFSGESLSTRAGISLISAAKAWAYLNQKDFVTPDDIQSVLIPTLGHRLGGSHGLRQGRKWAQQLQEQTSVPR